MNIQTLWLLHRLLQNNNKLFNCPGDKRVFVGPAVWKKRVTEQAPLIAEYLK